MQPRTGWNMSRYLTSIVEQALWSLLNLGVTLLLARLASPEEFGVFVFWSSIAYVMSSLQNALTLCHLQILPTGSGLDPERREVERLMLGVTLVFLIATTVVTLVLSAALQAAGSPFGAPAAALLVPAFLLQQYVRFLCFSRGQALTAAIQTGSVLVLAAVLLGLGGVFLDPMDANEMLLLLGAAYGAVGLAGLIRAMRGLWSGLSFRVLKAYGGYVRQSGWIFLGVASSELLARFYVFAIGGLLGNAVLALLSFSQTFLRPVPLLALSWSMIGRNDLVRRREAADWSGFARMIFAVCVGGVLVAAAWSLAIVSCWPLITHWLFDGKYVEAGPLIPLWGLAAAMGFLQLVISTGLQVLQAFKALALANAGASVVAALTILMAMGPLGYQGAILGTAFGQGLEALAMGVILSLMLRRQAVIAKT
jgi:O-antigen/teichoic acid export membrane protein